MPVLCGFMRFLLCLLEVLTWLFGVVTIIEIDTCSCVFLESRLMLHLSSVLFTDTWSQWEHSVSCILYMLNVHKSSKPTFSHRPHRKWTVYKSETVYNHQADYQPTLMSLFVFMCELRYTRYQPRRLIWKHGHLKQNSSRLLHMTVLLS